MPRKKTTTKSKKRITKAERVSTKELADRKSFYRVIETIVAMFLAIFVFLSNAMLCGGIGEFIRSIVLSLFGTYGYFLPLIMGISILITLFNSDNSPKLKIWALLILFVAIICITESFKHDFSIENSIQNAVDVSIKRAKSVFSFADEAFSGGLIGTITSYITFKAFGKVGSIVLFMTIILITCILLFGLGFARDVAKIIKKIIMFIPNLVKKYKERREEDERIDIDNENILKNTISKSKKANMEVTYDKGFSGNRLVLEPLDDKKKYFDTKNVQVSADDIQSRFYHVESKAKVDLDDNAKKAKLLKDMKKKSLNELIYEAKEKGDDNPSFFYTDKLKPMSELKNIVVPVKKKEDENVFENSYINVNSYENDNLNSEKSFDSDFSDDETLYSDDEKNFASGISELRNDNENYDNVNAKEFLTNIDKKNLEFKNNNIKNVDITIKSKKKKKYTFPPINLLNKSAKSANNDDPRLNEKAGILVDTLKTFGVGVSVLNIIVGPSVTRFELKPDVGVKISKILSLEDDVKLALAASEIRIEAPIPGKSAIGIEIPNAKSSGVLLGDIISMPEFKNAESKLTVAIGKDISGKAIITDLRKMPHLLIAGATGSGKSVCVNSLITSLIYKSSPEDVRLIMVDPKVVELQIYNGIPHLLIPVVTDPKKAAGALNWAVSEMTRRYNLIQEKRVRDIESYNQVIEGDINKIGVSEDNEAELEPVSKLPYIVIIIDEFADLMMVATKDVENSIMRIAQLARACGIYLVIATQRPTVNVISGSIKTNVPSRISFAVSSGIDSQTILDRRGAEKLLGHGDMLYLPTGIPEPLRVQGCYVSEQEILKVVDFVKDDNVEFDLQAENAIEKGVGGDSGSSYNKDEKDDMFVESGRLVIEQQNASIGMLQRRFRMGFNRAARIIDQLEVNGVISRQDGKKPREVLMTSEEFEQKFNL